MVSKHYHDERWCDHCAADTVHDCVDDEHERDSSGDQEECTVCGRWRTGSSREQSPPMPDDEGDTQ